MGRRRTKSVDHTLRQLLLREHRELLGPGGRWHIRGRPPSDYERALEAGEPVVVCSATLLRALSRAGLPDGDFAYGGRAWGREFLLGEDGGLTAYEQPGSELSTAVAGSKTSKG